VVAAIAHKEYRFIYPAIPLELFSAAPGSAEFCRWLAARLKRPAVHAGLVTGACIAWVATSFALATTQLMRAEWSRGGAGLERCHARRAKPIAASGC
jgi:hypothetical protein